jgi:integrin alpha FG-GAP repeat containing protein 1
MDIMVVGKKEGVMTVYVMWGEHDKKGSRLECTKGRVDIPDVVGEPLVFDYNGDYVSDLLTVDKEGNRTVYVFNKDRQYTVGHLQTNQTSQLKAEHSNAFIDITGDGAADLLLTTQTGLEMYKRNISSSTTPFTYMCSVPWPELEKCNPDQCVGQAVFTDFDLTGTLDMVLPVCFDPLCTNSSIYLVSLDDLSKCPTSWIWEPMSLELGGRRFLPRGDTNISPLRLLAPRVGDVDLDGFPDLLMTLYNSSAEPGQGGETHLLLNTPCGELAGCQPYWRQFQVQPGYTMGVGQAVTSAFFDLYEDGKMDLLVIADGKEQGDYTVSAFTNTTQDSDAYFIKVIVLSGSCYHNCERHSKDYVPYGTNTGGQIISYKSQRPGPETFDSYQSVAAQMPQTSHFSLGLPYTIFGLGLAPNFVDYLSVNISSHSHQWPQIIPNSQLYVIPYPPDQPERWDAKLIIFTSKNIVMAGLALIGTCVLVTIIIVLLHTRERRQDHRAKLQEANRFHFDAM